MSLANESGHDGAHVLARRGGAFAFAWLFKRTLFKGKPPLMIMELPPYRLPRPQGRLPAHGRAGRPLPEARGDGDPRISIVLWFLSAHPKAPVGATATQQLAQSYAGRAGH